MELHMPAVVWKADSQESLWDHSLKKKKRDWRSVTHYVIVWGNERITKWGREDTRISTDKWERSFLPVRRPNYSTTSSLLKRILRPSGSRLKTLISQLLTGLSFKCISRLSYKPQRPAYSVSPLSCFHFFLVTLTVWLYGCQCRSAGLLVKCLDNCWKDCHEIWYP